MGLDDFLDKFNVIDRAQGLIASIMRTPYRKSHKGRKEAKLRLDPGACELHIDRTQNTGQEAEDVLAAAHITVFGRRMTDNEYILSVKARQGRIAELRLLRAGIALGPGHKMIDPRNVGYSAGKGKMPVDFQPAGDGATSGGKSAARKPGDRLSELWNKEV